MYFPHLTWPTVIALALATAVPALAETKYLLADPGGSLISNYAAFYNNIRYGYETLRSLKITPVVIAKDGTWAIAPEGEKLLSSIAFTREGRHHPNKGRRKPPTYPPIDGAARDEDDFATAMAATGAKENRDTILLYLDGHGSAPISPGAPSTAAISGWNERVAYLALKRKIDRLPDGVGVKIVDTACFSGGVHSISRDLPGVCSASTTNHMKPSFGTSGKGKAEGQDLFAKGFWDHVRERKGRTSLAEAALAGFQADSINLNEGRLSSFDYVDFVLRRGPYDPTWQEAFEKKYPGGKKWDWWGKESWSRLLESGFSSALPPDATLAKDCTKPQEYSPRELDRLGATLNAIMHRIRSSSAGAQPPEVRTIFHEVIDDMKANGDRYTALARSYEARYEALLRERDELRLQAEGKSWKDHDDGKARARITRKLADLRKEAAKTLRRASFNHEMLKRLDLLEDFATQATAGERRKFLELLRCEWEPL